ncbi:antA/AntB antirepressor family protein [Thalassospira indica]|uniref:AntA/AntB antirepressor domain-containing protein n=1 Tax=Thalassospira indica TaxID=1891279 RepID=A0ABM6XVR2_9PROT|nr:antA/AntB antirepressor family protein [Thalassospira indica]AXO13759.1 hypothetical protein DY252_05635 [Thalassospira indica]
MVIPVKIESSALGGETIETVNARDLHAFLEVGRDFSNWIKARIERYGFAEGEDFIRSENLRSPKRASSKSRVQTVIDYYITLDMAKELSMVERTARGREARRYFIEVEKQWRAGLSGRAVEVDLISDLRSDGIGKLPGQRFAEERLRLGFATKRDFAKSVALSMQKITAFEDFHAFPKRKSEYDLFVGIGFDLSYWQWGERSLSAAERELLAGWREADKKQKSALLGHLRHNLLSAGNDTDG